MTADPTVFVVDDDSAAALSVAALVTSLGLKVEVFESAEAFLTAYDSSRKGCLVLDMRLTGMSGLELQETLRAEGADIPIIIISGHADRDLANKAKQLGAVAFLEKPYGGTEFCTVVRASLSMRSQG